MYSDCMMWDLEEVKCFLVVYLMKLTFQPKACFAPNTTMISNICYNIHTESIIIIIGYSKKVWRVRSLEHSIKETSNAPCSKRLTIVHVSACLRFNTAWVWHYWVPWHGHTGSSTYTTLAINHDCTIIRRIGACLQTITTVIPNSHIAR